MGKRMLALQKRIFAPNLPLEERIFNLLCFVGFFAMLGASFIRGLWISSNTFTFIYMLAISALLGLGFLAVNGLEARKGLMLAILAAIVNVLFPLAAFSSGGIDSGMTAYFVLGLAVFFVLLRGKLCVIMVLWNIATALTCYVLSYLHPELVSPLSAPYMVHVDSVLGILLSGFVPCMMIKVQTDAYIEEKRIALTAAKARSDFLANISHEIRTPLNAIIGVSEMELRASGDPGDEANLQKMHDSGVELLKIINDILDISKIESGHFEVLADKYDFATLLLDTVNQNIGREGKRSTAFKVRVSENIPRTLFGDEVNIRQIIGNLLSNAFKYTDDGCVELEINAEKTSKKDNIWLHIKVRDTGRGIKTEDLDKIFSEYGKLDRQATAVAGIGLGLTLCRKLTEIMGGDIEVQSEFGKGSVFSVSIPQTIVNAAPIGKETAEHLENSPALLGGGKAEVCRPHFNGAALVVDDVDINLDIAKSVLEDYGFDVDTANSGAQAVDMVKKGAPCYRVIFMDHLMPGMNGDEAVRAIRGLGGEYAQNVPIIGLSAGDRDTGGDNFFNEVQELITKPIDVQRLEKVLEKWLK